MLNCEYKDREKKRNIQNITEVSAQTTNHAHQAQLFSKLAANHLIYWRVIRNNDSHPR